MTPQWLLIFFLFHQTLSRDLSLQCWRCEITRQAINETGLFLDDCQAQFDFTQHTREVCDGKCWKSADLADGQRYENGTPFGFLLGRSTALNLKSSRRCYSASELVRAGDMGVNTSDGCRQVRREGRKTKEVCFCSDQSFCNTAFTLTVNTFLFIGVIASFLCLFH